jgi:cytochrome c-type biogenesis protein CcmH
MVALAIAAIALLLIAYAWLLPPLWKQARGTALVIVLALPLALGLLYARIGNRDALDPAKRETAPTLDQTVDALALHMRSQPDNLEGWVLLGRSRKEQERYGDAHAAFAQALKLAPHDPDLMVCSRRSVSTHATSARCGSSASRNTSSSVTPMRPRPGNRCCNSWRRRHNPHCANRSTRRVRWPVLRHCRKLPPVLHC